MTATIGRTTTLAWNAINVGDEVTPMDVPVTTTLIVAGAIASRTTCPSTTTATSPIHKVRRTSS